MQPQRRQLLGAPFTYYVTANCALESPLLERDLTGFSAILKRWRQVFDLRMFAYAVCADTYHLIVRHHEAINEKDERLRERWQLWGGKRCAMPDSVLRQRFGDLGAIMQSLAQRYSRDYHARHGGRGSIWAGRYRCCLLADDTALCAAIAWLRRAPLPRRLPLDEDLIPLAVPPLRYGRGGMVMTADEAPPGLAPAEASNSDELLDILVGPLGTTVMDAYALALQHGWAIGRPESLIECLSRIGRREGRGRSRSLRELDDELGLCGLWG